MTRAQGQDTTRKFSARVIHLANCQPSKKGGSSASATAPATTQGV